MRTGPGSTWGKMRSIIAARSGGFARACLRSRTLESFGLCRDGRKYRSKSRRVDHASCRANGNIRIMSKHTEAATSFLQMAGTGRVQEAYDRYVASSFIHHNQYFKGDRQSL